MHTTMHKNHCFPDDRTSVVGVGKLAAKPATTHALIAPISCAPTASPAARPSTSGRTSIDGVDYYYEVHGEGAPLLILHGGFGSIDMFGPGRMMPVFAEGRQVIAVDLQGHGRTTLGTRPIRCEAIADDLDTLLAQLGHARVDVLVQTGDPCNRSDRGPG